MGSTIGLYCQTSVPNHHLRMSWCQCSLIFIGRTMTTRTISCHQHTLHYPPRARLSKVGG
jgi:hypothetical protein